VTFVRVVVDDAFLVRGIQRFCNLTRSVQRLGERQWSLEQPIGKRRSLDELRHQRRYPVGFLKSVDRADMRVIEGRERARFARKSSATLGIGRQVLRRSRSNRRACRRRLAGSDRT
jgi:hypothetical protein